MKTEELTRDGTREEESLQEELRRLRALLSAYIADRETLEDALRAGEERYRSLVERAPVGIYRCAPEGRFLEANPALVRMLGCQSAAELQGLDIGRDVYRNPEDRAALYRALEGGQPSAWVEVEWKRRDGTFMLVLLHARLIRDPSGRILACEAIAENVTDRRREENLFRRHERLAALGTTLAGVAHELNNPLAAIKGFAQLLLGQPDSLNQRAALETIHRETDRAARIAQELLAVTRRQDSREREMIDLNRVVSYVLATRRYAMESRGIACRVELPAEPAFVLADPVQLEQVVLNLVLNAEQALAPTCDAPFTGDATQRTVPRIRVEVAATIDSVELTVEDNGPGVAEEDLGRIWDAFWTSRAGDEGTGLGLSVVRGIVTAHGGRVEARPAAERGLCVSVSLPDADRAASSLVQSLVSSGVGNRERYGGTPPAQVLHRERSTDQTGGAPAARTRFDILVVDDEASILGFIREALESRGHAVIAATTGGQALRLARLARFDVVICDLRIPDMEGQELIHRLRRLESLDATRFIVSTGDAASPRATRAIATVNPDAVLVKPYDIDALRRTVEQPES